MKENKPTQTKRSRSKKTAKKQPTLLEAIERVVELSKDSKMSNDFLLAAAPEIGVLTDSYGITEQQAVLFCICMERGPRRVDYDDFARHLDMSNIRVLSYASDIDALVHRRLLRYRDVNDEDSFDVYLPVIKALKRNEAYQLPPRTGLDCNELFEQYTKIRERMQQRGSKCPIHSWMRRRCTWRAYTSISMRRRQSGKLSCSRHLLCAIA